ncbi:MAG: hypothetical protein RXR17_09015 [Sulfolobaceae archaeon]
MLKKLLRLRRELALMIKRLTNLIKNLVDSSFLIKEGEIYRPADVLMTNAF